MLFGFYCANVVIFYVSRIVLLEKIPSDNVFCCGRSCDATFYGIFVPD
jgi:hypothetical protein